MRRIAAAAALAVLLISSTGCSAAQNQTHTPPLPSPSMPSVTVSGPSPEVAPLSADEVEATRLFSVSGAISVLAERGYGTVRVVDESGEIVAQSQWDFHTVQAIVFLGNAAEVVVG